MPDAGTSWCDFMSPFLVLHEDWEFHLHNYCIDIACLPCLCDSVLAKPLASHPCGPQLDAWAVSGPRVPSRQPVFCEEDQSHQLRDHKVVTGRRSGVLQSSGHHTGVPPDAQLEDGERPILALRPEHMDTGGPAVTQLV